jgi:heterotetrameric sarcosine oxidase delta subunit
MLLIPCPHCGPRDEAEFIYGGDATLRRPADGAPDAAWMDYIFHRDNPRGRHRELWWHSLGCRRWLVVERDTVTHEIFGAAEPGAVR